MNKGLKARWLIVASLVAGCVCLLGLLEARANAVAPDSVKAMTSPSAPGISKASDTDQAARRARRYRRRHMV